MLWIILHNHCAVHPLTELNITVTSLFPAGTAWLTTKCHKIFPVRFKYRSMKTIKSTFLFFFKMCWKCCPCTSTNSLYHLNRLELCHEEELQRLNSSTNYFGRKHIHAIETTFHKKKSQVRVNFTVMNWLQTWLQKLILLAKSHGCKAWTTVTLYNWSLSNFIALATDNFKMLVSCARHLSDFSGVCSNLVPILYSFSLVSTQQFLAVFLSRSDPVDLTLLISLWMPVVLVTAILGTLQQNFLQHFLVEPHFTYDLYPAKTCAYLNFMFRIICIELWDWRTHYCTLF
jgi:hypothetical protein